MYMRVNWNRDVYKRQELTHAIQYPKNAAHSEYEEIAKYNAFVLGVHEDVYKRQG